MSDNAANRLKTLRKSLNKSQAKMAEDLHIEQSTYSRYESGKTQLSLTLIEQICSKFKISPAEFFNDSPVTVQNDNGSNGDRFIPKNYAVPKELLDKLTEMLELVIKKVGN
jgi:transcriptional regulator with XRE-family HTH domain